MMLSLSSKKKQALKVDLIHLHKSPILGNLKGKGTEQRLAEHRAAMTEEQRSEINRK